MIKDAVFKNTATLMHIHQLRVITQLSTFMRRMNGGEQISSQEWQRIQDELAQLIDLSQDLMASLDLPADGN